MIVHIIYLIAVITLLFGATIFAHELGHFISARLLGMVVDVFSLGFGPALWKKKIRGVVYQIACIPIGGYVALPQMDPQLGISNIESDSEKKDDDEDEPPRDLPRLAPWKKIIVSLSGAFGNIILAILFAWIVYLAGKPSSPGERSALIGFVNTETTAYEKGIRIGDEIIAINNRSVKNWNEVLQESARFEEVSLSIKRDGDFVEISVPTEKNVIGLRTIPGLRETSICKVKEIEPESSAEIAGAQREDIIKSFNNVKVLSIEHLISLVSARADIQTLMIVERENNPVNLMVTPRMHPELERAVIGIRFDPMAFDYDQKVHIKPSVQLKHHATLILRVVRSLLTPKEAKAASEGLGGPFIIIYTYIEMVKRSLITAIWFTCFLNVNLAILNLMPIPILDGGHVVFSLWEMIFRKPPHAKAVIWLSNFFAGLLILAFILLTWRDAQRVLQLHRFMKPQAVEHVVTNDAPVEIDVPTQE